MMGEKKQTSTSISQIENRFYHQALVFSLWKSSKSIRRHAGHCGDMVNPPEGFFSVKRRRETSLHFSQQGWGSFGGFFLVEFGSTPSVRMFFFCNVRNNIFQEWTVYTVKKRFFFFLRDFFKGDSVFSQHFISFFRQLAFR